MKHTELTMKDLEVITGGKTCSVFDIFCVIGETLASGGGGPVKPPICSYPSASNPAPAVRCY